VVTELHVPGKLHPPDRPSSRYLCLQLEREELHTWEYPVWLDREVAVRGLDPVVVTQGVDSTGKRSTLDVAPNVLYYGVAVDKIEVISRDVRRWGAGVAYYETNWEASLRLALCVCEAAMPVGGVQDDDLRR